MTSRCPDVVPLPDFSLARAFEMLRRCIDLLMLSMAALSSATAMAIEEPAHTVIEREEPFEVRDFQSCVVAETFVDGSFNAALALVALLSGQTRGASRASPE